jgi:LuxR family maltose regulon positive regulatory protein
MGLLRVLQSTQTVAIEPFLTTLLNEITTIPNKFVLVLDDYHLLDAQPSIDQALIFLIKHLPPQLHLVIATREDPQLPLAQLRGRGQLTELRLTDLRFTLAEATDFLTHAMNLNLTTADIAALENRTEGWIAGLQLAALSIQKQPDTASFIKSFTGSHYFVLDYLVEEVLQQQPANIQTFLLRTSILERLCGSLCEAVLADHNSSGQVTLEYLEHSNLFIVPLDNERRWYRYHHLFAELLRQRLQQSITTSSTGETEKGVSELHIRASIWYEENDWALEAFHHATAANNIDRAERLILKRGLPLYQGGAVTSILSWLDSLPKTVLDTKPALWTQYASLLLVRGQTTGVAEKLQAAELALQNTTTIEDEDDDQTHDLIGQIATARATLALSQYQFEAVIFQARRAMQYLHPANLYSRFFASWSLACAYFLQGDRTLAGQAYAEALAINQNSTDIFSTILALSGLGQVQESENQLYLAAKTYQQVLKLIGEQPLPTACDAYIGLARIFYEWNDLNAAEQYGQQSVQLARQYDQIIDRFIISEVFLARLQLARGDVAAATALLTKISQSVHQSNFIHRLPEVVAAQILTVLQQGNVMAAEQLIQNHSLPLCQARIYLAQANPSVALTLLEPLRQQAEARVWQDERLKVLVLQVIALHMSGKTDEAVQLLSREILPQTELNGFIRLFVDEGLPMAQVLSEAARRGIRPDYIAKLLAVFEGETKEQKNETKKSILPPTTPAIQPLDEPLSQRELQILQLIAQGLSNREISQRLFIALITVKMHNQKIFGKLQVQRRTEAVARARQLGLI